MNTNPDETRLAMWLDDELTGADLAEMDVWAVAQPAQLEAREELRKYRKMISANIPASEEPPFPDFFLTRVNQGIRDIQIAEEKASAPAEKTSQSSFWRSWLIPVAACAGMILAFGIGKQSADKGLAITDIPSIPKVSPVVYTPEEGVDAQWFAGNGSNATVIILKGVAAIPDSTDFSETVYIPTARESGRMATRESEKSNTSKQ